MKCLYPFFIITFVMSKQFCLYNRTKRVFYHKEWTLILHVSNDLRCLFLEKRIIMSFIGILEKKREIKITLFDFQNLIRILRIIISLSLEQMCIIYVVFLHKIFNFAFIFFFRKRTEEILILDGNLETIYCTKSFK